MKERCVGCFKNLSVKSRFKIYNFIYQNGSTNVSDVTKHICLKQPTVSYHLKVMKKSGLLSQESLGRNSVYTVSHNCPHDENKCVLHN